MGSQVLQLFAGADSGQLRSGSCGGVLRELHAVAGSLVYIALLLLLFLTRSLFVQSDDRDASASAASAVAIGQTPSQLGALVKLVQVMVVVVVAAVINNNKNNINNNINNNIIAVISVLFVTIIEITLIIDHSANHAYHSP